jgi:hypothetical protein
MFPDTGVGAAAHFEREVNQSPVQVGLGDLERGRVDTDPRIFCQDR